MTFKKTLFFFTLTCVAAAAAVAAPGRQTESPVMLGDTELLVDDFLPEDSAEVDTVVIVTPDSLARLATKQYSDFRLRKLNDEDRATLYPSALELNRQTIETLKLQTPGTQGYFSCKDILKQLNSDLYRGAFYYSDHGRQAELKTFAREYLDTQMLDEMSDVHWNRDTEVFPTMCFIAVSDANNTRDFENAINYCKLYLSTGETTRRENVYRCLGAAALESKNYPIAIAFMQEAIKQYPTNEEFASIGIHACIDGGHAQFLQNFLTHALALRPNDVQLLTLQAKLYEDHLNYRGAIDVYNTIEQLSPNMLNVAKHSGVCYYNMGALAFNRAKNEPNEKDAKRERRQARNFFDAAVQKFRAVLETDPTAVKYLRGMGVCFLCLEDKSSFAEVNTRLSAMGEDPLKDVFMPPMMATGDTGGKNFATSNLSDATASVDAPTYREYSEKYLTDHFKKWASRGEFETTEKYLERVNPTTIEAERKRLERESAETYLTTYGGNLRLNNLSLMPYDPQNEVFQINSNYGPIIIQVPLKNNEAESFKAVFEAIDMRAPQYYIDEEGVKIASVTVVTPGGQSYKYDNDKALAYHEPPRVDFDYAGIFNTPEPKGSNPVKGGDVIRVRRKSDVDERIPHNNKVAENRVALIIANENYANAANVPSAYNDGEAMKEYCHNVLGMPENNIIYLSDATLAPIYGALRNLKNRVEALDGNAEVFVYYAGHGFPDEQSKSAYILPVDGYATAPETCLELSKFYDDLSKMNAASVMVFLDACFSGAERSASDAMLVKDGRTVVIKPKTSAPKGNMMILTATSDKETALPYAEKNHGLFTYYLLKHLQETKGNTTPKELSDYVISNVKRQSNFINSKPQTPTVSLSGSMSQLWSTMKLRP